jgi:putative heme iron utilization protein
MQQARFGVLSTLSAGDGCPFGSVVEFVADEQGRPVLATSTLSAHTSDMMADGRVSVTVMAQGFKNLQDARFCLQGTVKQLSAEEKVSLRELYLKKYPDAFYVDFGDFKWFRMEEVKGGRLIGGFGAAFKISADDYMAAKPDPITAFSAPVCGHMNEDHEQDTMAMIKHYTGLTVEKAKMLDLDRLGINLEIVRKGATSKMRLPFIRPADDRKSIKEVIVEMTKTAKAASAQESESL